MKKFIKSILVLAAVFLLFVIHVAITYLFPFPLNTVHVLFVVATVLLLGWDTRKVVWMALLFAFLLDIGDGGVFGFSFASMTLSMMLVYGVYRRFVTNRSWYSAFLLSAIGVLLYRGMELAYPILFGWNASSNAIPLRSFLVLSGWEIFCSSVLTVFIVGICSRTLKRFRTDIVSLRS